MELAFLVNAIPTGFRKPRKERELMFKKDSKKGLALGAALALFATLFVAAPAAQADANGVVVAPLEGTSSKMLVTEEFALTFALGQNVPDEKKDRVRFFVEKPAGYKVTVSHTVSAVADLVASSTGMANTNVGATATISSVVDPGYSTVSAVNQLVIGISSDSALTSVSPAVDIKVTVFIDTSPDGVLDKANEPYTTYTVNFVTWAGMGATVALARTPIAEDTLVTASATVAGVNFEQLNSDFNVYITSTNDGRAGWNASSDSGSISPTNAAVGAISTSGIAISSAVADESISAVVVYSGAWGANILASSVQGVSGQTIDNVTVSGVVSANLVNTSAAAGNARTNAAFNVHAWPYTGSKTTSVAVAMTMTMTEISGLSNDKYITIEGTKYTKSSDLPTVSGIVLAAGKADIDIATFGFGGAESTTLTFKAQNKSATYAVSWNAADYNLENGDSVVNTTPGVAPTIAFDIEDEWGVKSSKTNHRVVAYYKSSSVFSESATTSFAVLSGVASVAVAPSPSTATGSATLVVSLQTLNQDSGAWATDETEEITVVVSSLANGFTTSNVASVSASISYAVATGAFSWSATALSGTTVLGGTDVVVSAADVYFKSSAGKTASGTITVRSDVNGAWSVNAASAKAGTHTISFAVGSATTTSLLVVSAATHDSGKSISIDKTEILAGSTTTITGTLVDANGNPVATGSTASILVKWTGKGLPFNLPTATDADGEFEFQVLALSSEVGDSAVSVTYMPTGSTTSTLNITSAYAVDVVSSLTAVAADKKITVGTFKGYVAIYTKGYMGQKLSAKVAGKWLVVDPIAAYKSNDYSRTVRLTGAGYTITVDLYIDGAFVRSEVVTTK